MLFDYDKAIGFFQGLSESGLDFGAEITLNYDSSYQSKPMLGMYVIIELERPEEVILGRITAISSHGKLASSAGEDLGARSVAERRPVPEDIKQQFLRYRCTVRLLGLLKEFNTKIVFTPSHRRLPHMGAKVAFAYDDVLQMVAGAKRPGSSIGFFALGEFIYANSHPNSASFTSSGRFQLMNPVVEPRFDAAEMVERRTTVLARSGYGKSNLLKVLFSRLYENPPTIQNLNGTIPVGTLIFDPDGDYFWPGNGQNSPPGLCDLPSLRDSIVVATERVHSQPYYDSFRVTLPKLDIRSLSPRLIVPIAVPSERINHRGTEALLRLNEMDWQSLVDAAWLDLKQPGVLSTHLIVNMFGLKGPQGEATALGIRSTMLDVVNKLHDPTSTLLPMIMEGLSQGKMVIVDLSLMRGSPASILSAIILRYIFEHNVNEHTKPNGNSIPVIALIEEAQKVLEGKSPSHGPYIEWVKEGRKYGLGAVLVTQQPGAIDNDILSQTDTFFVFHLISGSDLNALRMANGHFSDDILATLLNEPIEGQGVFWTSTGEKMTYPIPFRAFNFGDLHQRLKQGQINSVPQNGNYAMQLKSRLANLQGQQPSVNSLPTFNMQISANMPSKTSFSHADSQLVAKFKESSKWQEIENRDGFPGFTIEKWIKDEAGKKRSVAELLHKVLTGVYGLYGYGWKFEQKINKNNQPYLWVTVMDKIDGLTRFENGEEPLMDPEPDDEVGEEI